MRPSLPLRTLGLLLLLLSPCSLVCAHGDGPACVDDAAVLSSDPSLCCPSADYALERDPRGSGPKCTLCRFDRYRCDDQQGGCCFADADCAINAAGWPVCVLAVDGAGSASVPVSSNRSGSDPRRDRSPSGTTSADGGSSLKLLASAILFVSALVGTVLLCDARRAARGQEAEAAAVAAVDEEAADIGRPSQSHHAAASILPRRKTRDADRSGTELERLTHAAAEDSQAAQLSGAAGAASDASQLRESIDDHLTLRLDGDAVDEAEVTDAADMVDAVGRSLPL